MIFSILQTKTGLFSADFDIRDQSGTPLGKIHLQGSIMTNTANMNGIFQEDMFSLRYGFKDRKSVDIPVVQPYTILLNNTPCGAVFETHHKQGVLRSSAFHRLMIHSSEYDRFPIGFGEQGGKHPIYHGTRQIAQIEKGCVVHNGLHEYQVFSEDVQSGLIAVLFACYMHLQGAYHAGEKVTKSVSKRMSMTTDSWLLEKYNPDFTRRIQQMDE